MVTSRHLRSALLAGTLVAGVATEANAQSAYTLNISSSVVATCVGGSYALATCEAIRFTLAIPPVQTLNSTGEVLDNGVPTTGGTFTNFLVSTFALVSSTSSWQFFTPNALLGASPGTWVNLFTTSSNTVQASVGGAVNAPISFDIRFATFQSTLAGIDQLAAQSTGNLATEVGGLNRTANWSSSTTVSTTTVPEPITMLLLGTGLAGVGGAARRRRKKFDVENA